ncbi:MAG: hypothetical protein HC844_13320 [Tabrizicola sp.]|nr:hypothetical protein [Tabrizicola sp.]
MRASAGRKSRHGRWQGRGRKGWGVTGEAALGPWTAVSFVGGYSPSTSSTCELLDGNVGVFAGDRLVALIYARDPKSVLVGRIRAFGDGSVRIASGDLVAFPVADLRQVGGTVVTVSPLAPSEPVCQGAASVPYIEGLPIDLARVLLAEAGWQPDGSVASGRSGGMAEALAELGIVEVEDCAGTGFGFCRYAYVSPVATLGVISVGEGREDGSLPTVSGYTATCTP